jgi:radical SAM protein with 4Fe4S-binding SPASM domain
MTSHSNSRLSAMDRLMMRLGRLPRHLRRGLPVGALPPGARNELLNYRERLQRRVVLRSRPIWAQIDLSSRCNLRCIMCSREDQFGRGADMSDSIFDKLTKELFPYITHVAFGGIGEPFLYPRIDRVLKLIGDYKYRHSEFVTNATFLTREVADTVVASGVTNLVVSMDGATRDTYERVRRGASFEKVVANVSYLRESKQRLGTQLPHVRFAVTAMRSNLDDMPLYADLAVRTGVQEVAINYASSPRQEFSDQELITNEFRPVSDKAMRAAVEAGRQRGVPVNVTYFFDEAGGPREARTAPEGSCAGAKGRIKLAALSVEPADIKPEHIYCAPPHRCIAPWVYTVVSVEGYLYPCCHNVGTRFGELARESFDQAWNSRAYIALRESLLKERLADCCVRKPCMHFP